MNFQELVTENSNYRTENLDILSTTEMVKLMNSEDFNVAAAVEKEIKNISEAVDKIAEAFRNGGRLVYLGSGTSGRLGILDASECPPTFGTPPEMVIGLIAGGEEAIKNAIEGAEDNFEGGIVDLKSINITSKDVVVGIAASGRTPYVIGAIEFAKEIGCVTVGVSCNPYSELARKAKISISPVPGPEILTGSTRLKAGSAQKMVLNMLSTLSMVKIGKVYRNFMVDLQATNEKLRVRQRKIVIEATGAEPLEVDRILELSGYNTKVSILSILTGTDPSKAKEILKEHNGIIRQALIAFNQK